MKYRLIDSVEVTEEKVHIIHLKTVFDASTADEFEQVLQYLVNKNFFKFVIDLAKVEFISSAGWGNFVGELQKIRDNKGDLKLAGMSKEVYDVFLLLELDMFIKSYANVDEALVDFSKNIIGVKEKKSNKPSLFTRKKKPASDDVPSSRSAPKAAKRDFPPELELNEALQTTTDVFEDTAERVRSKIIDPWFEGEGELELSVNLEPPKPKQPAPKPVQQLPKQPAPAPAHPKPVQSQQPEAAKQTAPPVARVEPPAAQQQRPQPQPRQAQPELEPVQPAPISQPFRAQQTPTQPVAPMPAPKPSFDDTNFFDPPVRAEKNGIQHESSSAKSNGASSEYLSYSKIRPTDLSTDQLLEKIVSVVIANPAYGPSAIRQMLIRLSIADESLTRSDIYRKLEEYDLSTRAKRIAFARANSL